MHRKKAAQQIGNMTGQSQIGRREDVEHSRGWVVDVGHGSQERSLLRTRMRKELLEVGMNLVRPVNMGAYFSPSTFPCRDSDMP